MLDGDGGHIDSQNALLHKWMLVKEDKPNSCYHFDKLLQNLHQMSAEEFAVAIRGQPTELNCVKAYDLIWDAPTRFKSVMKFREDTYDLYSKQPETLKNIKASPIILLDPIK